ncbi:MAG: hypothetical protein ACREDH_02230 [Methylocella sp.]
MGFLSQTQNAAPIYRYNSVQIQSSSNAIPIAILWGRNRLAPNAIWTGGFYSKAQKSSGKGGGAPQGYVYFTSFLLGLCEGPIGGYVTTYFNQENLFRLDASGLETSTGGHTPQAPWSYLSANFPSQALGYNGLAYVGAYNYNLGSTPSLPQYSFVLDGISAIRAGNVVNGRDSDPALIIQDFLTNA